MSNLLHNDVKVGDEVVLSAPFGDVVLEYTDRPVVMASAGIGITPMAGMLSHLVKAGSQRHVMLLHADDSPESFPLRQQVTEDIGLLSEASLHSWFLNRAGDQGAAESSFTGFMDVNAVELPIDAEYYLCGPLPFLQAVRSDLIAKGVPARDIQYEVFGPDLWLADFQ
jgi:nitric oxide dioxygenase